MTVVIFDLDGTLANSNHRLHFINSKPRNFDAFEAAIPYDTVIDAVANIYRKMIADANTTVILLTGRNDSSRNDTEAWLINNNLTGYDELIMKTLKFQPDTEQKHAALNYVTRWYGWPDMVFEDRPRVVQMWKDAGVFVFDVGQ